jgi:hypothetical protein
MSSDPLHANDPEKLEREIKDSIEKARGLADEMKSVQEYENSIIEDNAPPKSRP